MAKTTPTQRSLKRLRDRGYTAEVVERFVRTEHKGAQGKVKAGGFRKDLFGFCDIIAVHPLVAGTTYIQTTDGSSLSKRITKAFAEKGEAVRAVLRAGNRVAFHGWRQLQSGWDCRVFRAELQGNDLVAIDCTERF